MRLALCRAPCVSDPLLNHVGDGGLHVKPGQVWFLPRVAPSAVGLWSWSLSSRVQWVSSRPGHKRPRQEAAGHLGEATSPDLLSVIF